MSSELASSTFSRAASVDRDALVAENEVPELVGERAIARG